MPEKRVLVLGNLNVRAGQPNTVHGDVLLPLPHLPDGLCCTRTAVVDCEQLLFGYKVGDAHKLALYVAHRCRLPRQCCALPLCTQRLAKPGAVTPKWPTLGS